MNLKVNNLKTKLSDSKTVGMVENFLNENGPTISMLGAVIGLGLALYKAFKASKDVAKVQEEYEQQVEAVKKKELLEEDRKREVKELKTNRNIKYLLAYKWALMSGGASVALMFLCNYLNGAKIATLTAAVAFNEDKIRKLVKNGKEIVGEEKFGEIENKTLEELVQKNFMDDDGPIVIRPDTRTPGIGDIYVDSWSGVQFQFRGTEAQLIQVLQRAEDYCYRCHGLNVSKYYSMLGIPNPPWAWGMWGPNLPFKAHIGKRELRGATFKTIEYEYDPGTEKDAGVPCA